MYDFAHPVEDAIEGITHSLCTLEFEDHRPLYDWVIREIGINYEIVPRQIEFAKLNLTDTIMGKRYLRNLVETNQVDGWDDPRLCTICGIRRRGYTPRAIRNFCEMIGVAKANSTVDAAQLEYCVREDLKDITPVTMAVLDPVKVVITNYPEGKSELLPVENHPNNEALGSREVEFGREIYIEREDFMENPPKKYFRLSPDKEVRLKGAYFIKCTGFDKDEEGNITTIYAEYDPETKGGNCTTRKVKGTIHWVYAPKAIEAEVNLYENLTITDENSNTILNPDSIKTVKTKLEPSLAGVKPMDRFQFMRLGYFIADSKHCKEDKLVFNRIVSLKSSFKPEKA